MKNFTFTLFCLVLAIGALNAQHFFEDFESGVMPEDFTLINNDGLTPALPGDAGFADTAWMVSTSTAFEGYAALSISWYEDEDGNEVGPADDWMILPKLEISASSVLNFKVRSATSSGNFRDDYQVLINAGEPTVESFSDEGFLLLAEQEVIHNVWAERSIDLSEYAGQTMHIAFRNVTNMNGYGLWVNDIEVTNVTNISNRDIRHITDQLYVYPNPIQKNAILKINLLDQYPVTLDIMDLQGRTLRTINHGILSPGNHTLSFSMDAEAAGIYLLRVKIGESQATRALVKE